MVLVNLFASWVVFFCVQLDFVVSFHREIGKKLNGNDDEKKCIISFWRGFNLIWSKWSWKPQNVRDGIGFAREVSAVWFAIKMYLLINEKRPFQMSTRTNRCKNVEHIFFRCFRFYFLFLLYVGVIERRFRWNRFLSIALHVTYTYERNFSLILLFGIAWICIQTKRSLSSD